MPVKADDERLYHLVVSGIHHGPELVRRSGWPYSTVLASLRRLQKTGRIVRIGASRATRWLPVSTQARRDRLDIEIREVTEYLRMLETMRAALK